MKQLHMINKNLLYSRHRSKQWLRVKTCFLRTGCQNWAFCDLMGNGVLTPSTGTWYLWVRKFCLVCIGWRCGIWLRAISTLQISAFVLPFAVKIITLFNNFIFQLQEDLNLLYMTKGHVRLKINLIYF